MEDKRNCNSETIFFFISSVFSATKQSVNFREKNIPKAKTCDFAYNYLHGSIPVQWASMQLRNISVLANRLSGEIPKELGSLTSLTYLFLETNQFSGALPSELGKLVNLDTLVLSSNQFTGNLPPELAELTNLTDFRINDNNFNGTIPDFIQNWKQLRRLEMHASGLKGPIPSSISVLEKLTELRISDINGSNQEFRVLNLLENMTGLNILVLRSCNISGTIPEYIWKLKDLQLLDLSFNKLVGNLSGVSRSRNLLFIFLSGNLLSGDIPELFVREGINVDLSYNNFTWQNPEQVACQKKGDLDLNLFRSSSMENKISNVLPCIKDFKCPRYWHSFYVNCGGDNVKTGNHVYEKDAGAEGGDAARSYLNDGTHWGFSSTGDFMDDNDILNKRYIATSSPPSNISDELYTTARLSPLSLTYYRYCLENGSYTDKLVQKEFNIADEAQGFFNPIIKHYNVTVTNNILEIRFYWAGKGTTRIPKRGVYGPLISAISVDPSFIPHSEDEKKRIAPIVLGVVGLFLILLALGFVWWRCCLRAKVKKANLESIDESSKEFGAYNHIELTREYRND